MLFLVVSHISFPELIAYASPLADIGKSNVMDSFGIGAAYLGICYLLGWVFFSFLFQSMRDETEKQHQQDVDETSLDSMYQWIRLSHPAAGFRIVKLRAEARMLEVSRVAMVALLALALAYILISLVICRTTLWPLEKAFWTRPLIGALIAVVSSYGFRRCEGKAWSNYCENIRSIYSVLHDPNDPIKNFEE